MNASAAHEREEPFPRTVAWQAVGRCVLRSVALVTSRRIHQPRAELGREIRFADGTVSRVYRETIVDAPPPRDPCVLIVAFRLRGVHGRGHALFRWESVLNTPLFVGFPGFVSKLWLAHDLNGTYRGIYEWDSPGQAAAYARSLWRVLELVSQSGSIAYHVSTGLRRGEFLDGVDPNHPEDAAWWRAVPSP